MGIMESNMVSHAQLEGGYYAMCGRRPLAFPLQSVDQCRGDPSDGDVSATCQPVITSIQQPDCSSKAERYEVQLQFSHENAALDEGTRETMLERVTSKKQKKAVTLSTRCSLPAALQHQSNNQHLIIQMTLPPLTIMGVHVRTETTVWLCLNLQQMKEDKADTWTKASLEFILGRSQPEVETICTEAHAAQDSSLMQLSIYPGPPRIPLRSKITRTSPSDSVAVISASHGSFCACSPAQLSEVACVANGGSSETSRPRPSVPPRLPSIIPLSAVPPARNRSFMEVTRCSSPSYCSLCFHLRGETTLPPLPPRLPTYVMEDTQEPAPPFPPKRSQSPPAAAVSESRDNAERSVPPPVPQRTFSLSSVKVATSESYDRATNEKNPPADPPRPSRSSLSTNTDEATVPNPSKFQRLAPPAAVTPEALDRTRRETTLPTFPPRPSSPLFLKNSEEAATSITPETPCLDSAAGTVPMAHGKIRTETALPTIPPKRCRTSLSINRDEATVPMPPRTHPPVSQAATAPTTHDSVRRETTIPTLPPRFSRLSPSTGREKITAPSPSSGCPSSAAGDSAGKEAIPTLPPKNRQKLSATQVSTLYDISRRRVTLPAPKPRTLLLSATSGRRHEALPDLPSTYPPSAPTVNQAWRSEPAREATLPSASPCTSLAVTVETTTRVTHTFLPSALECLAMQSKDKEFLSHGNFPSASADAGLQSSGSTPPTEPRRRSAITGHVKTASAGPRVYRREAQPSASSGSPIKQPCRSAMTDHVKTTSAGPRVYRREVVQPFTSSGFPTKPLRRSAVEGLGMTTMAGPRVYRREVVRPSSSSGS